MIYFEKILPGPRCLEVEKSKNNGNYKCGDVLQRLKDEFHNKCYICEQKRPTTINVEHFIPHNNRDKDLKFDWENLFLSCGHCNKIKGTKYTNILRCTDEMDNVSTRLKYIFEFFPIKKVKIVVLEDIEKVKNTRNLLNAVYNGKTLIARLEAENLRVALCNELLDLQEKLSQYFRVSNPPEKVKLHSTIVAHLSSKSAFTAFKHWLVKNDDKYYQKFQQYVN